MSILSRIKNGFSSLSLSYKLISHNNDINHNFMRKIYKNGILSFFSFMFVNLFLIFGIYMGLYFNSIIGIPFIILFIIHIAVAIACFFHDEKYFLSDFIRNFLFKFTKKYNFLVKKDKEMQNNIIDQDELTDFIRKNIAGNDNNKTLFAKLLTKKKFKPFTQYELLKFSIKNCKSSSYINNAMNDILNLYLSECSILNQQKETKFSKGLEIIDSLASGKKLGMNEKGQIILNNQEHLISVKKGE